MKRILDATIQMFAMVIVLVTAAGCTTVVRSNFHSSGWEAELLAPRHGIHLLYARDGRLIQKTVWRDEKLVSAWEHQVPWSLELSEAVSRGERNWPPPRWTQVVKKGDGRLTYLDAAGEEIGFAVYAQGEYVRGAH